MADAGPTSKLKAVWHSVLADHDRNFRGLQSDFREFSQLARNKVRDLQDQRKVRKQTAANFDLWEGVNQGVGSPILTHFKNQWSDIHTSTTASSQRAAELYLSIQSLQQSMSHAHDIVSNACEELGQLPAIVKSVEQAREKVESVGTLIHNVEAGIEEYVKLTARLEMERKKHSARIQLDNHKEEQQAELQKWVELVSNEKKKTLDRQELLEQLAQRERQETFDSIFAQQMAEFKEKGEVDRPIVSTEETRQRGFSETSLEEVKIDDNAGDEQLQEFLSDVQEGDKIDKTKADEVGEDKTKADEVGEDKTKADEEDRSKEDQ